MSVDEILSLIIGLAAVSLIVIVANLAERQPVRYLRQRPLNLSRLVTFWLLAVNIAVVGYGLLALGTVYLSLNAFENITRADGWKVFLISAATGSLNTSLLSTAFRRRIAVLFPPYGEKQGKPEVFSPNLAIPPQELQPKADGTPLFPQILNYYTAETQAEFLARLERSGKSERPIVRTSGTRGFDPESPIHLVALFLCVLLLGIQMISFVLSGGLTGIAESYEENGLSAIDTIANTIPFVVLAFLGVGLGTRRTWAEARERLGLYAPRTADMVIALGTVLALFALVAIASVIWMELVSKETYEEQSKASEALAESIDNLGLAFLVAIAAAIGEEIAYRGALQPVFGLWPTAIIFSLSHIQYTLTPAWLIILAVALAFGWLRERGGTVVSIWTHFCYNFIPLAVSVVLPNEALPATLVVLHQMF